VDAPLRAALLRLHRRTQGGVAIVSNTKSFQTEARGERAGPNGSERQMAAFASLVAATRDALPRLHISQPARSGCIRTNTSERMSLPCGDSGAC
jgi:hypothetical protein